MQLPTSDLFLSLFKEDKMIRLLVDEESFDEAMTRRLIEARLTLFDDYERVKTDGKGFVFHVDYDAECNEIRKHLDALQLVIEYFGGKA
jgi:hypothetical protein